MAVRCRSSRKRTPVAEAAGARRARSSSRPDINGPLRRVSADGGACRAGHEPGEPSDVTHRMPHLLPRRRGRFLFIERGSRSHAFGDIAVPARSTVWRPRVRRRAGLEPAVRGRLPLLRKGSVTSWRSGSTLERLAVDGPAIPIADRIEYYNPRDIGNFSVSAAGLLVYRKATYRQGPAGLARRRRARAGDRRRTRLPGLRSGSVRTGRRATLSTLRPDRSQQATSGSWISDADS